MAQALNDPDCDVSFISDEGIESASSSHEDKNCDNCKKQLLEYYLFHWCCLVLPSETLENIMNQKMLVPTFLNNNDYPDDISELPYGYETYIRCFPKFKRSDR